MCTVIFVRTNTHWIGNAVAATKAVKIIAKLLINLERYYKKHLIKLRKVLQKVATKLVIS